MDALDPRSIRKGSKIRLDDTTEGSDGYVGGTVGHIDPNGFVVIDHMGTFVVEGLTTVRTKGYTVYRLTEHTPPKPDPLAELIRDTTGLSSPEVIARAIREKFRVFDPAAVDQDAVAAAYSNAAHLPADHEGILAVLAELWEQAS